MNLESLISVIIPAYNRAHLLSATLHSLLSQTLQAHEIIVVDDGSTDDTAEVAASFGPPVRVIRQKNAGPAAARNTGFRASRGEFIHFFDSDDIALSNKHEVQLRALETSGADIAYGPWVKGQITADAFMPENLVLQQHGLPNGDLVKALLTNWSIVPHACLFRRGIIEKVGGFPEHLFVAEDQLMFLKCLLAGAKVVHSPGTLELYRSDNAGKITDANEGKARHVRDWARFLVKAASVCKEAGIDARSWFGFRRRVWEARQDIRIHGIDLPELSEDLQRLLDGGPHPALYRLVREFQRKRLGLFARMGRGRAHPCFKAGRINQAQSAAFDRWKDSLVAKTPHFTCYHSDL